MRSASNPGIGATVLLLAIAASSATFDPGSAFAQSPAQPAAAPPSVKIGVAAAVQGKVEVASGGAVGRVLESGRPIFMGDVVTTGPGGRLQILLLDQTIFTIGPNSSLVIDEFVYDPATDDGRIAAQVVTGAFRFVTGRIGHKVPDHMKVTLPAGTIGIRGTMVAGRCEGDQSLIVLLGPGPENSAAARVGRIDVENAEASVTIAQPGFGTTIPGADLPPTPPALIEPQILEALNQEFVPPAAPADERPADRAMGSEAQADDQAGQRSHEAPAMMMRSGRDGGADHDMEHTGPPTAAELHAMADAGHITPEQLTEMLADMEAWHSGDESTRQALMAKYGSHEGESHEGAASYESFEGAFDGVEGMPSGDTASYATFDGLTGQDGFAEMGTPDAFTEMMSGDFMSYDAFSSMMTSNAQFMDMMTQQGFDMEQAYQYYMDSMDHTTAAAQDQTSSSGTTDSP
jgi:hypothetical protein